MTCRDDEAESDAQRCAQAPGLCYSLGFIEPVWGQTMRDLIWSTKRLTRTDWVAISTACQPHLQLFNCAKESEAEEHYPDRSEPHASVHIDW